MQTAKYTGVLLPLSKEFTITKEGTIYTDELFDGIVSTKHWLQVEPTTDKPVHVSVYKTDSAKSTKLLVEQYTFRETAYMLLDGFGPFIVEIKNPCKVKVKTFRL